MTSPLQLFTPPTVTLPSAREQMTWARYRKALELFHRSAEPLFRARCELEAMMPLAFVKQPDGSLTKIERYGWPDWAIRHAADLELLIDHLRERAFKDL